MDETTGLKRPRLRKGAYRVLRIPLQQIGAKTCRRKGGVVSGNACRIRRKTEKALVRLFRTLASG